MANTTGKKYGGRKKGTPNRLTKDLRFLLKEILHKELEKTEEYLEELEPKERLEMIIKMMPFILPKVNNTSHTSDEPLDWDL